MSGDREPARFRGARNRRKITQTDKYENVPKKCIGIMRKWQAMSRKLGPRRVRHPIFYATEVRPCLNEYNKAEAKVEERKRRLEELASKKILTPLEANEVKALMKKQTS